MSEDAEDQVEEPWQISFPPFYTLQPHSETRAKQIEVWRSLVLNHFRESKKCILDIQEASQQLPFCNISINRCLNTDFILAILSDLQRTKNAAPIDKERQRWEIYWHTLQEFSTMLYDYVISKGATNSVLTLFELIQGEDVQDEEFSGLDTDVLIKVLHILELDQKCELMLFDDHQGVKFF